MFWFESDSASPTKEGLKKTLMFCAELKLPRKASTAPFMASDASQRLNLRKKTQQHVMESPPRRVVSQSASLLTAKLCFKNSRSSTAVSGQIKFFQDDMKKTSNLQQCFQIFTKALWVVKQRVCRSFQTLAATNYNRNKPFY